MKTAYDAAADADIIAFVIDEDGELPAAAAPIDQETNGLLTAARSDGRFSGKLGEQVAVVLPGSAPARRAVLIGGGKADKRDARTWERLGAEIVKANLSSGFASLALHVDVADNAVAAAVGAKLAAYRFDGYFTKQKEAEKPSLEHVSLVLDDAEAARAQSVGAEAGAAGAYLARDLMNEPGNVLYPEAFADRLNDLVKYGVEVEILDEKQMAALGMRALLGVGQGSARESKLGVLRWSGAADADEDPVVLVGKGVCFDSGGISLKPGKGMEEMKGDMGGAAAVAGAMLTLAMRKAKANVVGLVGLVENMPDGAAQRPGDIVTAADGQTIEIHNTDAEGRLVLADVLWYAQDRFKPKAIVDLATLTGAIVVALGHDHAGLFANDDGLAEELRVAGESCGETVWRLPLGDGYDKLIKSEIADMKNLGGPAAGSATAAQFLKRFIKDGTPWAHLDIAGVAWRSGDKAPSDPSWASGFGARLLDRWVAETHEK